MVGPDRDGPAPRFGVGRVGAAASDQQNALAPPAAAGPSGCFHSDQDKWCVVPTHRARGRGEDDFRFCAGRGAQSEQIVEEAFVLGHNERSAGRFGSAARSIGCVGPGHFPVPCR